MFNKQDIPVKPKNSELAGLLAPKINRYSMLYRKFIKAHDAPAIQDPSGEKRPDKPSWVRNAFYRRLGFFLLLSVSVYFNASAMFVIISTGGLTPLKWSIFGLFLALMIWVITNFWIVMFGFLASVCNYHPFSVRSVLASKNVTISPETMTAILFPIYNENIAEVYSRIKTVYLSLEKTGELDHFHFYVLSDSSDPDKIVTEEVAWEKISNDVFGYGRIFYRHRNYRTKMKYGNIADFCKRWGKNYKYMIVLDSDSIMSGRSIVELAKIMEERPDIGILQTPPQTAGQETLHSRINQFTNHLYGPFFFAGLHFLRLGDAEFWGHNAIIRMMPYMKYCALPKYPGKPPFGGEIFSHDFVEAAFMRRAGWGIWIAFDIGDSFEQIPSNLSVELERDYRWCQGNIQHLRFVFMRGISLGHRFMFMNGNMFYFSYLLWFLFLVLVSAQGIADLFKVVDYFPAEHQLFPVWPRHNYGIHIFLLTSTAVFLLAIKGLGFFTAVVTKKSSRFGGTPALFASVFLEMIYSAVIAPVKMLFHTRFIIKILLGKKVEWDIKHRLDNRIVLTDAIRTYGFNSVVAFMWGFALYFVNKTIFWGLQFILVPALIAIPFTMFSSMRTPGLLARKRGLFLTPEEISPSPELVHFAKYRDEYIAYFRGFAHPGAAFLLAVKDKDVHELHMALLSKQKKYKKSVLLHRL
ncbi:MAG: glucans biosynthesis glucosyltransferase MdoH, partial [Candidatus Omnitrophica bacterium]|nr:glucans biosynthesis glucosyltransferase MdoH [Candidatus Omnitrophota bacterium]